MAGLSLSEVVRGLVVTDGSRFRLKRIKTGDTRGYAATKEEADEQLQELVARISKQQETLYARDEWSVLLIFQAMDAAGKDSAIKRVLSGINPQGVQVFSFKAPSAEELDHDFLWRTTVRLPERGRIGVFNRSYYEEVLVVRVHPELLGHARLPAPLVNRRIWKERFEDINAFELHMARNGCVIRKFFLHVSRDEQARRFLERLEQPEKRWKFSMGDVRERDRWRVYMRAYEDVIRETSTPHAPWIVVPADRKWFARLVIARALFEALSDLKLRPPEVTPGHERELEKVRDELRRSIGQPRRRTSRRPPPRR